MALFRRRHREEPGRREAPDVNALAQKREVGGLVALLGDPRSRVREAAREALKELWDPSVAEALKAAVRDVDQATTLRDTAFDALLATDAREDPVVADYRLELQQRPAPEPRAESPGADPSSWYCAQCGEWVTRRQAAYQVEEGFPPHCFTCDSRLAPQS